MKKLILQRPGSNPIESGQVREITTSFFKNAKWCYLLDRGDSYDEVRGKAVDHYDIELFTAEGCFLGTMICPVDHIYNYTKLTPELEVEFVYTKPKLTLREVLDLPLVDNTFDNVGAYLCNKLQINIKVNGYDERALEGPLAEAGMIKSSDRLDDWMRETVIALFEGVEKDVKTKKA